MKTISLLVILVSFSLASCGYIGETEIIIVPRNFKGYAIVVYDQKDSMPVKYDGNKRIYEIPQTGILRTQFNIDTGWREFPEYYYERIATENKVPTFANINSVPIDKTVGLMGAIGTVKKDAYSEDRIVFSVFYIGTKSEIEQAQEQVAKLDIVKLLK